MRALFEAAMLVISLFQETGLEAWSAWSPDGKVYLQVQRVDSAEVPPEWPECPEEEG